ncbi:MAG: hypothetical protein F7C34_03055 [Desulfurococcales archaeon]|nr:hypothetical protein [Desulfurococcales archaeon]
MSVDQETCKARKDFVRHIANKIIASAMDKLPASVLGEIRKRLGRLEDKYDFSVHGGRPERLAEALSSDEWNDLVEYAEKSGALWVLRRILEEAAEAYKDCPRVYEKIAAELERLQGVEEGTPREELTIDKLERELKYRGFRVERKRDKIIVDEGNITAELSLEEGLITYRVCKEGKAHTLDGVLVRIEKLREL